MDDNEHYCRICGELVAAGEGVCLYCDELRKEVLEGIVVPEDMGPFDRRMAEVIAEEVRE